MSDAPAPQKICVRCGQDCSGKPRIKDQQGRYVCQECVDKARKATAMGPGGAPPMQTRPAAAQKTAAAGAGGDDLLMGLIDEANEKAKDGCPSCRAPMKPDQVMCIRCGYNRESGKQFQAVVQKPQVIKEKGAKSSGAKSSKALTSPLGSAIVVAVILGVALIGAFMQPEQYGAVFLGALNIYSWIVYIWVIVLAFQAGVWEGVLSILCGLYQIYFVYFGDHGSDHIRAHYTVFILAFLAQIGWIVANIDSLPLGI